VRRASLMLLSAILSGCTAADRLANLQTAEPESSSYEFSFLKRIIPLRNTDDLPPDALFRRYERDLDAFLHRDPNTAGCNVVSGSINFGEPGSSGSAEVHCVDPLPLQESGMYTLDRDPVYLYWVIGEES
jgi:hypothetical protein